MQHGAGPKLIDKFGPRMKKKKKKKKKKEGTMKIISAHSALDRHIRSLK